MRQEADLEPVWRALSDPTRRRILDELRTAPRNTMGVCEAIDSMGRHGVINHLKVLEAAGLVRVEASGRERINHLNATPLQHIYERWLHPFEQIWAGRLYGLTRTAEAAAHPPDKEQPMNEPEVRVVEIVQEANCAAPAEVVWSTMVDGTDRWWTVPYVAPESLGISLTLEPGGTLWDQRAEGGYAVGVVRGFTANRELILDGDFGIPGAMHGRFVATLTPDGEGSTNIRFHHTVIGAIAEGATDGHEAGWGALLQQLCEAAA